MRETCLTELFPLILIQSPLNRVCLLEFFKGQDQKLGIVFVIERREWNGRKLPTLEPMDGSRIDGYGLFGSDVYKLA
jgi:hypothetical protein